jgi:predicted metal-dependent RNase
MKITPHGGAQEVGRSCYQVDAGERTYLVDCGIKQAARAGYPSFHELESGSIDAVFITHAHIDHIGALPVAEHQGLLADDAPIITTRPTNAIASILLNDTLKIHQLECEEFDQSQKFTDQDVRAVLDRIDTRGYGRDRCYNVNYVFGNAGHLLGSAWIALEHNGRRVVFSGDLGGRSAHLPSITEPPTADTLVLESTYGDILTHRSFTDARTELFDLVTDALAAEQPVLIPTFGVGRSQEVLQLFREREEELHEAADGDLRIVYDGMIRASTPVYNVFATDEYVNDTLINYRINSQDTEPFLPDCAWTPDTMPKRWELLDGERAPIIVSPSGMLTGGWSPFYLWEFTRHYDDAHVAFIGYQAHGTPGRELLKASGDDARVQITTLMHGDQSDDPDASGFAFHKKEITVPTRWVRKIDGLSGHAAGNTLLQFARETNPTAIHLVHGDHGAAIHLRNHLADNTNAEQIEVASQNEQISVGRSDAVPNDIAQLEERCDRLRRELNNLEADIAALKDK